MKTFSTFILFFFIISCNNNQDTDLNSNNIDISDLTGAFNLFPLALNPEFTSVSDINIGDNSLVGIISFGNAIRVFPYEFMTHNEIVNDEFQGIKYAFSYCPLTKSSLAFKRNGIYRASGYLLHDNLTPWDEETETIWSQMLMKGIIGNKEGVQFNAIPVLETRWKTVKDYFPNARVVTSDLFFTKSSSPPDEEGSSGSGVPPELNELVYGIVKGNKVHIFKYVDFSDNKLLNITIEGQKYIVYGNSIKRTTNAFKVSNFENYSLMPDNEFPYILEDINGVKYDVLGRGTNGITLEKPKFAYVAIWKAWLDFYDNFEFQE